MWKYVLKRICLALVSTVIILSMTFILMKLLPPDLPLGDEAKQYSWYLIQVQDGTFIDSPVPLKNFGKLYFEYVDGDRAKHFFYQNPVLIQYVEWIKNIVLHWNWGTSTEISPNVSAMVLMAEKIPVSLKLNVISVIFAVPLGIILGIVAALKKNTATDHIISTGVMVFISIPSFIMIMLLILLFHYTLHWLPAKWPGPTALESDKILAYIIPVLSLSFGSICGYARFTRAELCEVMESEYLLLARTKGLTKKQAIVRHALRNAMVPIVPSILAEFLGLLSGSMILEQLYGIPGIGGFFFKALQEKDYNVLFVDMAIFTTLGLLAGVLLDLSYGFIDPRIRMGAKK